MKEIPNQKPNQLQTTNYKLPITHIPVLLHEAIEAMALKKGSVALDATLGGGGHAKAILSALGPSGTLIGLDEDEDAISRVGKYLAEVPGKKILARENFRNLARVLKENGIFKIDAALFDLGLSSFQFEESGRGFSFLKDEPLAMTLGIGKERYSFTASDVVNKWEEENLRDIIAGYGEERYARRIARAIVLAREKEEIKTARELAEIISAAVPGAYRRGRIHPATRTFQAIRIAVNDELSALKAGIAAATEALAPKGRIAVISFHSLEDRIVKNFFRDEAKKENLLILTKKPIIAKEEEIIINPRSRSAKLRVAQKTEK
ncbi:MAG: 16S rRNA (cytosine(1402)-N(4))-methyltransferase RsmH [Patescibacteria group bacterium]